MTIININNVDEKLLKHQTNVLAEVIAGKPIDTAVSAELEGLLDMLESLELPTFVFIHIKEWFDKVNGNSYWSSRINVNGQTLLVLPLQYGYGNHGECESFKALVNHGDFPEMLKHETNRDYMERNYITLEVIKETAYKKDAERHGEL